MSETVLILGAGFSKDAGIPLLGNFVERMWEIAIRGKSDHPLTEEDKKIFTKAMSIRDELDGYHGRAAFNSWNIEDLLSILSFNVLVGGSKNHKKIEDMSAAIARTIELTCTVKHPGLDRSGRNHICTDGPQMYRNFWKAIFDAKSKGKSFPTIITFNYDLVLERSLFQVLIGTYYSRSKRIPFNEIQINYHYPLAPPKTYSVEYANYLNSFKETYIEGSSITESFNLGNNRAQPIEILKLHGSLNFPRKTNEEAERIYQSIVHPVMNPYLLPPIFNKFSGNTTSEMWRTAIQRIRSAKNLVIVGYSLPTTDIYMQYFIKSGIGPNRDLNKITVFDPILFSNSEACAAMKRRYESCFADQLRSRIDFEPNSNEKNNTPGTTDDFIRILGAKPETLLF